MSPNISTPGTGTHGAAGDDSTIAKVIVERGITEVLHFTTAPPGFVGICATGMVRTRDRLEEDKYLEHIYTPNCRDRNKDPEWTDHISLSISRVNNSMLGYSKGWHPEAGIWWVVLSFDPAILTHPGVYFATTNNSYSATVRRATGAGGLADLFSSAVPWGYFGSVHRRRADMPAYWTTDIQAEVLYPGDLPVKFLRAAYVAQEDHIDQVKTWLDVFPDTPAVPVTCKPEVFA